MSCKTCPSASSSSCNDCFEAEKMDVDTPLESIQNGDKNFCFSEITPEICENLSNDKGIHPTAQNENNDCDDLKSLNDLAIGNLNNNLMCLDLCDVDAYKKWLLGLLGSIYNIFKGIICAICGIWSRIHCLIEFQKYMQCQLDKVKSTLLDLVYSNIETEGSYVVQQETPNLSIVVNSDGTFRYEWSDWDTGTNPWRELGHGVLTGKVIFSLDVNQTGGLDYNITGVHLDRVDYVTKNASWAGSEPRYYILIPAGGTQRWTRNGTVNTSWTEVINATYQFSASGTLAPNSESAYIDFMTWGADWQVDDKVLLRFKFINNNSAVDLDCTPPTCKL